MKTAFLLLLMGAAVASADVAKTRERTVTRLAEGVYVIRHPDAPDEFEVEFGEDSASQVLRTASLVLHFHATCFAAWELERELWLRANRT